MGWPQGLASPCACIWALVARIAVVCCADLCGSLPCADHCFGHYLGSLLLQFNLVDRCFGRLFCQICVLALPSRLAHSGHSELRGPSHGLFARCLETFWFAMPSHLTHSGRSEARGPTRGLFARCLETFGLRLAMSSYPASNCGSVIVVCCLFSGLCHDHIRGF